jgi:hypothetical protein
VKDFVGQDGGVAPFVAAAAWALLPLACVRSAGLWLLFITFMVTLTTLSARSIAACLVPLMVPLCAASWRYGTSEWLVAGVFAALSLFAITRRHGFGDAGDRNLARIASWLMLIPAVTIPLDPAKLPATLGALTYLIAAIILVRSALRRHRRRVFFASIARGHEANWRIGAGRHELPPLFDPPGSVSRVLFERLPSPANGPYRTELNERPIALVK